MVQQLALCQFWLLIEGSPERNVLFLPWLDLCKFPFTLLDNGFGDRGEYTARASTKGEELPGFELAEKFERT